MPEVLEPSSFAAPDPFRKPTLAELGAHLTTVSRWACARSLLMPFVLIAAFFTCARQGCWALAVPCTMALTFVTYGSISHDLVHRTLGLPGWLNDLLLKLIEGLCFRSGTAYRATHLHHHARFPAEDDVEARAARLPLWRSLIEGPIAQPRQWGWAWRRSQGGQRLWITLEGAGVLLLITACVAAWPYSPAPAVYAALMIAGSWTFPLITVHLPHDTHGSDTLTQTRLFRGSVLQVLAFDHLYHLEHHLYPQVPHHRWAELARRLDPYFAGRGLRPKVLWR